MYYLMPSFEIQDGIFKVFDEPSGESDTETRVEISASISKEDT